MQEGQKALLAYINSSIQLEDTYNNNTAVAGQVEDTNVDTNPGNGGVSDGVSRAGMVEAMHGQGGQGDVLSVGGERVDEEPPHTHVRDAQGEVLVGEDMAMMNSGMDMGVF